MIADRSLGKPIEMEIVDRLDTLERVLTLGSFRCVDRC